MPDDPALLAEFDGLREVVETRVQVRAPDGVWQHMRYARATRGSTFAPGDMRSPEIAGVHVAERDHAK